MKLRFFIFVRNLRCRNHVYSSDKFLFIHVYFVEFVLFGKDEETVSVRKSSFLELYGIDPSLYLSKELTIDDVSQELFQVDLEDPSSYVWSVVGLLLRVEVLPDLLPLWVASEGDEKVRFSFVNNDSHSIVVSLSHVSFASLKGRRKDHLSANLFVPLVGLSLKVVLETYVVIYFQLFLMSSKVVEVICLHSQVGSDDVFLEEPSSKVERVKTISSDVFDVFLDNLFFIPKVKKERLLSDS